MSDLSLLASSIALCGLPPEVRGKASALFTSAVRDRFLVYSPPTLSGGLPLSTSMANHIAVLLGGSSHKDVKKERKKERIHPAAGIKTNSSAFH